MRSLPYPVLLALISLHLQILSGLVEASGTKNEDKDVSHKSSMGIKIIIVCLSVVALLALSVFLFKLWQKKKREAQHARLLKLFEDDDELEVELAQAILNVEIGIEFLLCPKLFPLAVKQRLAMEDFRIQFCQLTQ
ncbi:uncharacterized protein DS421_3g70650 [Arachis hypogaea]|nr:uncharacterized protein DS421_3g70650 [Arachis hypogaea]